MKEGYTIARPLAIRPLLASASAIVVFASVALAAGPTPEAKRQAGASFDEGVRHAAQAEYDAAARAFLRADELAPNATALTNAMAAARRGNADLLLAEAAQRALDRGDAQLATTAREALLDAEKRLARLELGCEPAPCKLRVDGALAAAGKRYVLPGDHVVTASGDKGAEATKRVSAVAGTQLRVALVLETATPAPSAIVAPSLPPAPSSAPARASAAPAPPSSAPRPEPPEPPELAAPRAGRGLPPGVFYGGLALTAVLAGVTTWSGLNALSSKPAVGSAYTQRDKDAYDAARHRTDYLLAGTALFGVATAICGIALVDWGPRDATVALHIAPGGASLSVGGAL